MTITSAEPQSAGLPVLSAATARLATWSAVFTSAVEAVKGQRQNYFQFQMLIRTTAQTGTVRVTEGIDSSHNTGAGQLKVWAGHPQIKHTKRCLVLVPSQLRRLGITALATPTANQRQREYDIGFRMLSRVDGHYQGASIGIIHPAA